MRKKVQDLIELRNKIAEASDAAGHCGHTTIEILLVAVEKMVIHEISEDRKIGLQSLSDETR